MCWYQYGWCLMVENGNQDHRHLMCMFPCPVLVVPLYFIVVPFVLYVLKKIRILMYNGYECTEQLCYIYFWTRLQPFHKITGKRIIVWLDPLWRGWLANAEGVRRSKIRCNWSCCTCCSMLYSACAACHLVNYLAFACRLESSSFMQLL